LSGASWAQRLLTISGEESPTRLMLYEQFILVSGLFLFVFIQLNRWTNVQMGPRAPISMLA